MAQTLESSPTPSADAAESRADAVVVTEGVTKSFSGLTYPVLDDLDLRVVEGEILSLLGPSGCGKTTLLRLLAGFEAPDGGRILVRGREMAGRRTWVRPEERRIGFVFQDHALFPHLTVEQNVAFGLRARRGARRARAQEVLNLVGLTVFAGRYPHELSGGQQQRVAVARALAPAPEVVLLDEPFSGLDAALRDSTRDEVRRILEIAGTTVILVTHDQEEALAFGDRLAVLRSGRLEQVGTPDEVYRRPRTAFVASFLGRTNLVHGQGREAVADTPLGPVSLTREASGPLLLSVRPEDLAFDETAGVSVRVVERRFHGHDLSFVCELPPGTQGVERLVVRTGAGCTVRAGDVVRVRVAGSAVPLRGSATTTERA